VAETRPSGRVPQSGRDFWET